MICWQIANKMGCTMEVSGVFCWQIAIKVGDMVEVSGVFCWQIAIKMDDGPGLKMLKMLKKV